MMCRLVSTVGDTLLFHIVDSQQRIRVRIWETSQFSLEQLQANEVTQLSWLPLLYYFSLGPCLYFVVSGMNKNKD